MSDEFVDAIAQAGDAVGDRFSEIEDSLQELAAYAVSNRTIFEDNNRMLREILSILKGNDGE